MERALEQLYTDIVITCLKTQGGGGGQKMYKAEMDGCKSQIPKGKESRECASTCNLKM